MLSVVCFIDCEHELFKHTNGGVPTSPFILMLRLMKRVTFGLFCQYHVIFYYQMINSGIWHCLKIDVVIRSNMISHN